MSNGKGKTPTVPTAEVLLPHYPSLHRCVLIDARHASRIDIVKDLKASSLFEVASEAKSLDDGLTILQYDDVDACFLGPSVTLQNAIKFLKRSRTVAKSTDCAFIVMVNREDAEAEQNETLLLDAGAHAVVKRPCTKLSLTDWVIRAVVKANGSGAWASIFRKSGHDQLDIPDPFAKKHTPLFEKHEKPPAPQKEPTVVELTIGKAVSSALTPKGKFYSIRVGVENGEFRLDPMGVPTFRTQEEITRLIAEVLPEVLANPELQGFSEYLDHCLQDWVVDLINSTPEEAGKNLRSALRAFGRESKP